MRLHFLRQSIRYALSASIVACILTSVGLAAPATSMARSSHSQITLTEEDYWAYTPVSNAIKGLMSQYEKLHPNVSFQRTIITTSLPTKLLAQSATNSVPSIIMSGPEAMPAMIAANVLVPITSQIQAWGQWNHYLKSSQANTSWQGQIYGIAIGANDLGLFYNKDMFKAAGIAEPPVTWDQLMADGPKLTHGTTYAIALTAIENECGTWQFLPWLWTAGGSINNLTSAASLEGVQLWTTLVNKGWASKSAVNWCQDTTEQQFIQGRAAMMENGPWNLPDMAKVHNFQWGVVPFPVVHAGDHPVVPMGGEMWSVGRTDSAQQAAAWDFIKWTQTPAVLQQFNEAIGYIPVRDDVRPAVLASNPLFKPFADELPYARPRQVGTGVPYPQISTILITAVEQAMTKQKSPQAAFAAAATKIKPLLKLQ